MDELILQINENNYESLLKNLTSDEKKELVNILDKKYNNDNQIISDSLYDKILLFLSIDVDYVIPMPSLDKFYSIDHTYNKRLNNFSDDLIVMPKLNGIGFLLIKNGKKISIYIKKNSINGADISEIIPFLNVDLTKIKKKKILLRGEMIMEKKYFSSNGLAITNGLIHRKIHTKEELKNLELIFYTTYNNITRIEQLKLIESFGLKIPPYILVKKSELDPFILFDEIENQSLYNIDGIVISDNKICEKIIKTNPIFSIAFKIDRHFKIVVVDDIVWNSNNRFFVPKIIFKSVSFDGKNISKISGYNAKFIFNNKIGIGGQIEIVLRGGIIPKFSKTIIESKIFNCPPLSNFDGINLIPINKQEFSHLKFIALLKKYNIKGIGEKIAKLLFEEINKTTNIKTIFDIIDAVKKYDILEKKRREKIKEAITIMENNFINLSSLLGWIECDGGTLANTKTFETLFSLKPSLPSDILDNKTIEYEEIKGERGYKDKITNVIIDKIHIFASDERYKKVFKILPK